MEHDPWLHLTLAVLATWRLTHLLAEEDGPADMLFTARQWLGSGFFGKLMDCFYCLSLWVAAPFAYLVTSHWRARLLLWLALSGASCLLEKLGHPPFTMHRISSQETGED